MSKSPGGDADKHDTIGMQAKAILTDNQFWIPLVVLLLGIALLIYLH